MDHVVPAAGRLVAELVQTTADMMRPARCRMPCSGPSPSVAPSRPRVTSPPPGFATTRTTAPQRVRGRIRRSREVFMSPVCASVVPGLLRVRLPHGRTPGHPAKTSPAPPSSRSLQRHRPGTVDVGQLGEEVVTIANIGDADLLISDLSLATGSGWSITATGLNTLAPDDATTAVLTWEALDEAAGTDTLSVSSNDPETPVVDVPLAWNLEGEAPPLGELVITPRSHDFGLVDVGITETVRFTLANIGDGPLTVDDLQFGATSSELALSPLSVPLPWALDPGDTQTVDVTYTPVDDIADEGAVVALSDGGDQQADVFGNGKTFEGFSTGWYVWDPRNPIDTTTNPDYVVDHHGDEDVYYYENSGMHGMTASTDVSGDFAVLRDYVIANAGAPIVPSGPFDWDESSTVSQFNEATFTYFLCDFFLPADADPTTYTSRWRRRRRHSRHRERADPGAPEAQESAESGPSSTQYPVL